MPFFIALFLFYLTEPLQRQLNRWKFPHWLNVCLILLISFAIMFLVGILVYASSNSLIQNLPQYEDRLLKLLDTVLTRFEIPSEEITVFTQNFRWSDHIKPGAVAAYIGRGFGTFMDFVSNLFWVLLYLVYLLVQRKSLPSQIRASFDSERGERIMVVLTDIHEQIVSYLDIKTIISLGTGILAAVILSLFGVDFALFWGILTFLLNFIPAVGSIIATIPPIIVTFLQFEELYMPASVGVLLIGVQTIMGNVVEPKVMGDRLGINPLVVILALIFWGWLWGPVGMILSVPIVAAIMIVCTHFDALRPIAIMLADKPPKRQ